MFFSSVWTWSKQCPQCPFQLPFVCACVLLLAAPTGELHFPLGFPCSTTRGRWMFASFCILAKTRVVPGMPSHLHLYAGGVVTHILSPLAKGGAVGESGARWNWKGGWRCPFVYYDPFLNPLRYQSETQTPLLATGSAPVVQPSSRTGPRSDPAAINSFP